MVRPLFNKTQGRVGKLLGHFRVPKTLTLKTRPSTKLSCENELYFHDNKKSFSQERCCTWPRFKTEACGIAEMAYFVCIGLVNPADRLEITASFSLITFFRMELCLLVVVSKLDALLSVTNSRKMATPRFKPIFHFPRYNET